MVDCFHHCVEKWKNSGKVRNLFNIVAVDPVTCVSFVKAHSTRFQNHKYRATKVFINNYLSILLFDKLNPSWKQGLFVYIV